MKPIRTEALLSKCSPVALSRSSKKLCRCPTSHGARIVSNQLGKLAGGTFLLVLIQIFTIYGVIMSVIGMFVTLTQVDFMLIRILADMLVNHVTTFWFLRGKKVDAFKYEQWKRSQETILNQSCSDGSTELSDMKTIGTEKQQSESDTLL